MRINHNIAALNTHRQLNSATNAQSKSMEKLSSGLRINRAGDDAAGLAISEKMRGQIRGLDMASKNAQDGISLIQTAEGALNETHSILQRMRELAVQSSNDTNTESDRKELQKEVDQLTQEIDRIANTTEFNTQKLLNGDKAGLRPASTGKIEVASNTTASVTVSAATDTDALTKTGTITITRTAEGKDADDATKDFTIGDPSGTNAAFTTADDLTALSGFGDDLTLANLANMKVGESVTISIQKNDAGSTDASNSLSFQIGANEGQNILVGIDDMRADALGLRNGGNALDITDSEKATAAVKTINNAIEKVSSERSKLGATQNRLEHTINNLNTSSENLTAAESRVRDVDYTLAA
ncbi:flagellin [Rossellomorea marisflavi]|uniref:flagellin N-terminal helical domain-containing protein n=1 Tax=Rossellomorea marisflavi TaxID=189381 RepID=UPI0006A94F11|nr:flagellin [Rossellomorea marisflavi]